MRRCPLCCGSTRSEIWKQNFLDVTQRVYECGCGMIYAESPDVNYIDDSIYACPQVYGNSQYDLAHYQKIAYTVSVRMRESKVLDIGCSTGGLMEALNTWFSSVEGIDLSPKAVEIAKSKGLRAICGGVDSISKTYDLVTLSHVLEHVPQPRSFLRKIRPILNPNGILYIEVPDRTRYELLPGICQVFNLEHINHFSMRELMEICHKAGYEIIQSGRADPPQPWGIYPAVWVMVKPFIDWMSVTIKDMIYKRVYLEKSIDGVEKVAVWGLGQLTMALFGFESWKHIKVEAATDTNTVFHGRKMLGVKVVSPEKFNPDPETPILVASLQKREEIVARIKELGLPNPLLTLPSSML